MGNKAKVSRPVKRLKPFFWNKLANLAVTPTVWNEAVPNITFDMDEVEKTFTIDNSSLAQSQILKSPSKKQNVTTLLDITRANNVGMSMPSMSGSILSVSALAIMLSRIKMSFPDIRKALLELDDHKLSYDDLKAISKQLPTSEEVYTYSHLTKHMNLTLR
jgi:hypothetical protein